MKINPNWQRGGITIRLEIASRIMAGYAARSTPMPSIAMRARWALQEADALIAVYNEEKPE